MINSDLLEEGLESVWSQDSEFQITVLRGILKNIREMSDDIQEKMLQYLMDLRAFYVPHEDYLIEHFGMDITLFEYGIFINGINKLHGRLAIPLRLMNNKIVGFVGYSNTNDIEENGIVIKYLYPPKNVLDKGRYFFIERDEFIKAINDKYICIVDGIFDKIALQCNGINAVSLCGSRYTMYHKLYLSVIENLIVINDNDDAGIKLYHNIKRLNPNTVQIVQNKTKDIDSFMKNKDDLLRVKKVINQMKLENYKLSHRIDTGVNYEYKGVDA